MPSLIATIGLDNRRFTDALGQVSVVSRRVGQTTVREFEQMARSIENQMASLDRGTAKWNQYAAALRSVQAQQARMQAATAVGGILPGRSTVDAPTRPRNNRQDYIEDFERILSEKEEQARLASVEEASRRVKASQLRRQRAEEKAEQARLASVESASRANQAAALRRQRAEERAESARLSSVEAASRANRAAALRRQRAEDKYNSSFSGQIGQYFGSMFGRISGIVAAAYTVGRTAKEAVETDIAFERMRTTLRASAKTSNEAAQDFEFLRLEANRVGFNMLAVGDDFARFSLAARNAGLNRKQTQDIFSSVMTAGSVMGLSRERQSEALLALEQMLSKTTVSMQELRLQLGNAMPSAVNTFAQALGMSTRELFAQVEAGRVLSNDALPKFAEQLRKSYPLNSEDNKEQRNINRMQTARQEAMGELGKAARPATGLLSGFGEAAARTTSMLLSPIDTLTTIFSDFHRDRLGEERAVRDAQSRFNVKHRDKPVVGREFTEAELKEMEAVKKLEQEIAEEKERARIATMTSEERRLDLIDKIRRKEMEVTDAKWDGASAVEAEQRKLDLAKLQTELARLPEEKDKEKSGRIRPLVDSLTSNQRIGAYIGGPELQMLDTAKASHRELIQIRNILTQQGRGPRGGSRSTRF